MNCVASASVPWQKQFRMKPLSLVLFLVASVCCGAFGAEERATVRPADNDAALDNPGMGWVFHFYDNHVKNYGSQLAPSDTVDDFPGLTVVYLRLPWSLVEPEEGRFNWSVVDTPAQRWIARGKQVAFRFTCCESFMRYATPEWVAKAGAKGHNFKPGKGATDDGPFWEPDYDDPVFLEKLDHFLAAAAARYDGNPEVAFVDVGSFGVWGEGHTHSSSKLPFSAATVRRHVDLYCKHFKRTLLAANDDLANQGRGQEAIDDARAHGLTLRDDSILVQGGKHAYFSAAMAQAFWPATPVILESEHYGGSRDRGHWKDGSLYLQAVEDYHASYVSIHWWPREFLAGNRELVARINRRLGYRLQLAEASWPRQLQVESRFRFSARWRNAGVAPCYGGGWPALTLKDAKGGIAGVFVDGKFDARALPVGAPDKVEAHAEEAEFTLPFNLRAGPYDVFISVGTRTGTPKIALPLPDGDGARRYRLGALQVTGDYAVRVQPLQSRGDKWLLPVTWSIHRPLPDGVTPFFHFDSDGKIAFTAWHDPGARLAALAQPGEVEAGCLFAPPESGRGKSFTVRAGLWLPQQIGRPNERLLPDDDEGDHRVTLGQLRVGADGTVTFEADKK